MRFWGSKFGRPSPRAISAIRASRRVVGRVSGRDAGRLEDASRGSSDLAGTPRLSAKRLALSCERALVFSRLRGDALEKVFCPLDPAVVSEEEAVRVPDFRGVADVPLRCGFGDLVREGAADFERGCNDMS